MTKGFIFTMGTKCLFYETELTNITDKIARAFINKVCDIKNVGDGIRKSALYNVDCLKDFKKRIAPATLEKTTTQNLQIEFYRIQGKYFSMSLPKDEFIKDVVLF